LKSIRPNRPLEITNYTKFPNNVLDNLPLLTHVEFKIIGWMVRQNVGYIDSPNYTFSLSYLSKNTGVSRSVTAYSVKKLIDKNVILEEESGPRNIKRYRINWNNEGITIEKPLDRENDQSESHMRSIPVDNTDLDRESDTIKETNKRKDSKKQGLLIPLEPTPVKARNGKSDHAQVKELFHEKYLETTGQEYYWTAKDGSVTKKLLSGRSVDEIRIRLESLVVKINSGDKFYSKLVPCPGILSSQWNNLEGRAPPDAGHGCSGVILNEPLSPEEQAREIAAQGVGMF